jgi:hypothetical protein
MGGARPWEAREAVGRRSRLRESVRLGLGDCLYIKSNLKRRIARLMVPSGWALGRPLN